MTGAKKTPAKKTPAKRRKKSEPPPLKRGGRYYFEWEGPDPLPGVTTVLGSQVNKPALQGWAARLAAEAALRDPTLSIEEAANARNVRKDTAADRGHQLHAIAEAIENGGKLEDLTKNLSGEMKGAVRAFLDFNDSFQPKTLFTEMMLGNSTYGYAGTLDRLAEDLAGRKAIFDYKFGRAIYDDVDFQLSGYLGGEYLVDPATREIVDFDMSEVEYAMVVHLKPDGTWAVRKGSDKWADFIFYLHLYRSSYGLDCRKACPCSMVRSGKDEDDVVVGLAESAAKARRQKEGRNG